MLSECEFGRLVRHGIVEHPVSWNDTAADRRLHAGLALQARHLKPLTIAETAAQANVHVMNERAYANSVLCPEWDIALNELVRVSGLATRPDLEGCVCRVAGLDHKTKRVGIRLDNGSVIYVLLERLPPCDIAEGDGGIAYDHSFFLDLQAVVLAFITTAASDELGVSFDRIVAAMVTLAATASIGDIRVVVDKLVYDGDCYTTVDDQHVLAV